MDIVKLVLCFSVAFGVSILSTPFVKVIAQKIGAIDVPDARRVHTHPIPRMGGLAIFYGFLIAVLCFSKIDAQLRGILIGSLIITAIELIFGIVFNRLLKLSVWDYSDMPFNLLGQVCPLFSFDWLLLCAPISYLSKKFEKLERAI